MGNLSEHCDDCGAETVMGECLDCTPVEPAEFVFEIEDDVPLSSAPRHRMYEHFTVGKLQPGQSFFVPNDAIPGTYSAFDSAIRKMAADAGHKKISIRNAIKGDVSGRRVWRIE